MVGIRLLHPVEEDPTCAAADDKQEVETSREENVQLIILHITIFYLAHVKTFITQARTHNNEGDYTPYTENCAAH